MPRVRPARGPDDLAEVRRLVRAYAKLLPEHGVRPDGVLADLQDLPGAYAPPTGEILLAEPDGGDRPAGVVVLAPWDDPDPPTAQVKRLYVEPRHRGEGLARALMTRLMELARDLGVERVVLGTLEGFRAARALYEDLGFQYGPTPEAWDWPGVRFMHRDLDPDGAEA